MLRIHQLTTHLMHKAHPPSTASWLKGGSIQQTTTWCFAFQFPKYSAPQARLKVGKLTNQQPCCIMACIAPLGGARAEESAACHSSHGLARPHRTTNDTWHQPAECPECPARFPPLPPCRLITRVERPILPLATLTQSLTAGVRGEQVCPHVALIGAGWLATPCGHLPRAGQLITAALGWAAHTLVQPSLIGWRGGGAVHEAACQPVTAL